MQTQRTPTNFLIGRLFQKFAGIDLTYHGADAQLVAAAKLLERHRMNPVKADGIGAHVDFKPMNSRSLGNRADPLAQPTSLRMHGAFWDRSSQGGEGNVILSA